MDTRYKALVETAMGEGKAVPGFVRDQSMFTGGVSRTAGPRYPLTKIEFDAKLNAGERLPNGEIPPAKQTHPLRQSEYNAMIREQPAQAAPRSAKEPLPVPETAGGRSVEGRSVEGGSAGKAGEPAAVGTGKTGERAHAGKGIEAGDDGFREGLIGEEGKRIESASDDFTEGLLGKEGKAGGEGELLNSSESVLDLRNAWEYREYIRDIEQQTGRAIPNRQLSKLAEAIKNNKFFELDEASKRIHRKLFKDNKSSLLSEWERQTGQVWPRYDKPVFDKNGEIARFPGECYDAHEIIPNDRGGPIEWWNIHPAKWPNEHQGGIHRASGLFRRIFYK